MVLEEAVVSWFFLHKLQPSSNFVSFICTFTKTNQSRWTDICCVKIGLKITTLRWPFVSLTGSVLCMIVMGSLRAKSFRANRLIWYSSSGERSLTTIEVWPGPKYSSCRLLLAVMGIICSLYPETSPIEGYHDTRMDFEATSRTWRLEAGSMAAKIRIGVLWLCRYQLCAGGELGLSSTKRDGGEA